jgi:hypothetical protein
MERSMHETPFSQGFRLNPIAKGSPRALVVLLRHPGTSIETVAAVAARWAASVPAAAFVALGGIWRNEPTPDAVRNTVAEPRNSAEPDWLDHAARNLAPLVAQELRARRLAGIADIVDEADLVVAPHGARRRICQRRRESEHSGAAPATAQWGARLPAGGTSNA